MGKSESKKGMEFEMLGWWIIALVIGVIFFILYLGLKGYLGHIPEYFKNLLRFGGGSSGGGGAGGGF